MLKWDCSAPVTLFPSIYCTCAGAVRGELLLAQEQQGILRIGRHGGRGGGEAYGKVSQEAEVATGLGAGSRARPGRGRTGSILGKSRAA